jgi:alkylation response protein AidB-like acyl-CoA dehydrogenase
MENELQPQTEPGRQMMTIGEELAQRFAIDAACYDREGTFPFDHIKVLQDTGFMYAPAPVELGGMGVESVHDVMVATSRLARGDASITLGVNMHLLVLLSLARQRRMLLARGEEQRAKGVEAALAAIVAERRVIAAAISEVDQDPLRPNTTAVLTDGRWVVNGRKIFSSMSPAATHFTTAVTYTDDTGKERYAYAMIPGPRPV